MATTRRRGAPGRLLAVLTFAVAVAAQAPVIHFPAAALAQSETPAVTDPDALLRLGELYYDGKAVPPDLAKAYDYYRKAAAAGSVSGKLRAAAMLARGEGVAQDIKAGRKEVQEVADTGSAEALQVLGELYARGDAGPMDARKAVESYKAAADKGNSTAMIRLAEIYLYGRFEGPKPKQAAVYYRQAAKAGNPWGKMGLGMAILDGAATGAGARKEAIAALQDAAAAGVSDALGAISDSYFFPGNGKPDVKAGIGLLTKAQAAGNLDAALELVSVYRDGKRRGNAFVVPRSPAKAQALLASIKGKLEPHVYAYQSFMIAAATASPAGFAEIKAKFDKLPRSDRKSAFRQMLRSNERFYFYLVQDKLSELGLYAGARNGAATGKTLKAIASYCQPRGTKFFCSQGPASGPVAELLSYAF